MTTTPNPTPAAPASFAASLPVTLEPYVVTGKTGLVVIDEVNGFCRAGAGPLAPAVEDPRIESMIVETDRIAREFSTRSLPILAFRDSHRPGRPERPYPEHCVAGSGHDELVARLLWLYGDPNAVVVEKDCNNAVVGGMGTTGESLVFRWIREHALEAVVFAGICTDICVLDPVVTLLSARNHWVTRDGTETPMLAPLRDVVVHEPACATYDLPAAVAASVGLPPTAAHPAAEAHHAGLYVMQSRGAVLSSTLSFGAA